MDVIVNIFNIRGIFYGFCFFVTVYFFVDFFARAHQVVDKLADAATQTSNEFYEKSDEYKKIYSNASNTVTEYIQQKPLQSLGIAVAIGFAAGWLLKKR